MADNWIPITVEDLEDKKLAALVTALREKALGASQTDPTPRIIQAVVDMIRRKVASCARNRVDADLTTIPKGLKTMAVDLIYAEMKGRLEEPLTTDESRAIERHTADLNRIADCRDAVDQPDDATDPEVEEPTNSPTISEGRRETRNARRSGL
jgi:hypothetical protein